MPLRRGTRLIPFGIVSVIGASVMGRDQQSPRNAAEKRCCDQSTADPVV